MISCGIFEINPWKQNDNRRGKIYIVELPHGKQSNKLWPSRSVSTWTAPQCLCNIQKWNFDRQLALTLITGNASSGNWRIFSWFDLNKIKEKNGVFLCMIFILDRILLAWVYSFLFFLLDCLFLLFFSGVVNKTHVNRQFTFKHTHTHNAESRRAKRKHVLRI